MMRRLPKLTSLSSQVCAEKPIAVFGINVSADRTMNAAMTRITKPDHVLVQEIGDEVALLNVKNETYFALDDVGTRMWTHLTSGATVQEAHELLLAEYDVDPDRLHDDLQALIRELVSNDLACLLAPEVA
jgi:hypothetical protein